MRPLSLRSSIAPFALVLGLAGAGALHAIDPVDRRCHLTVRLDPGSGTIEGDAVFVVADTERFVDRDRRLPIALDPRLTLESPPTGGKYAVERIAIDQEEGVARWTVAVPRSALSAPIELHWSGGLRDDVQAGEAPGRIHNTGVRAHIGMDGIYLAPEAAWHPILDATRSTGWSGPDSPLCLWTLEVSSPFPLVASGDRRRDDAASPPASGAVAERKSADPEAGAPATALRATWTTPFPQASLAIAGGPLTSYERTHGAVLIRAMLRESSAVQAPRLLDAAAHYLDLYEPLLGPYPFREFAIVENFFSSGFALPGFTLLSSQVIQMGERGLRPGYLDHELTHNWWGNGVLSSRASGHWAEALATYCANYMRPVLEGRNEPARAQRRAVAETLSGSPALAAQVVGRFGLDEAISNFVGYQKGAMVFDQLAAVIGQDRVWAGLRRFSRDRLGRPSGWDDLRAAFEAESGGDLAAFFSFWVDSPGLPAPALGPATWDADANAVRVEVSYREPVAITLPIRLRFDDGAASVAADSPTTPSTTGDARASASATGKGESFERVTIHQGDTAVRVPSERRPTAIEIDPGFETVRRLRPELLMPTLSGIAPPIAMVVVASEHDLAGYAKASAAVEERYGKSGQIERRRHFEPRLLERGHVLVLGKAALERELQGLFGSERIELWDRGFALDGVRYVNSSDALLACARNPRLAGAFVCLYRANGDDALERPDLLPFYGGNSLLVFGHGQPVERRDFETVERIEVGK